MIHITSLPHDCESLLASVIESPLDPVPKLVMADCLDEIGLCGESMRWAARNKKAPALARYYIHLPVDPLIAWTNQFYVRPTSIPACTMIPYQIRNAMSDHPFRRNYVSTFWPAQEWRIFSSYSDAWIAFISAFAPLYEKGSIGFRGKRKSKKALAIEAIDRANTQPDFF